MTNVPNVLTDQQRVSRVYSALLGIQQQQSELEIQQLVNGHDDSDAWQPQMPGGPGPLTYADRKKALDDAAQKLAKKFSKDMPAVEALAKRQRAAEQAAIEQQEKAEADAAALREAEDAAAAN